MPRLRGVGTVSQLRESFRLNPFPMHPTQEVPHAKAVRRISRPSLAIGSRRRKSVALLFMAGLLLVLASVTVPAA